MGEGGKKEEREREEGRGRKGERKKEEGEGRRDTECFNCGFDRML